MKQKKMLGSLLLAFFMAMVLVFSGCGNSGNTASEDSSNVAEENQDSKEEQDLEEEPKEKSEEAEDTSSDSEEDRSVTITDMSGDEVTIEGKVEKIIDLWPAGTSSFFVMGAGDLISGVGNTGTGAMNKWTEFFYPGCMDITSLGGTEPSVEEVIAQNPDLVIIHPSTAQTGLAQQIREAGIPAVNLNFSDYETMIESYTTLGEILGGEYQKKLTKWCQDIPDRLEEHRALTVDLTEEEKPVVYYIAGQSDDLLTTMGAGSIMQDWVESNGGIFASGMLELTANGPSQQVTAEELFKLNPDVIIVGGVFQHTLMDQLQNTDGWKELKAVQEGRVYNNPYGCFNWDRFGLESLMQVDYALLCIQPEIASKQGITRESMAKEVQEFYQFYNGKELTDEEAQHMLDGLLPDGTAENPAQ